MQFCHMLKSAAVGLALAVTTMPGAVAAERSTTVADAMAWASRIKLSGDLRYRHETIDEDGREERNRQRIRARLGLTAKATDNITVGIQLATGGDSPTSTNQTLGDGASTKSLGVDLAYFKWQISETMSLSGGKFKNPFYRPAKSSLLWDGDLNPEGLALKSDHGKWFASLAGLWIEERSSSTDSLLVGGQVGLNVEPADGVKLTAGAGYYDIGPAKGHAPFYDGKARGNSVDAEGNYLFDYKETELFAALATKIADRPFVAFANIVRNSEADAFDSGWTAGFAWGKAKKAGQWGLGYAYKELEADAVLANWSDSDFAGGGTDGTGHVLTGAWGLSEKSSLKFTLFVNERGENAGAKRDYNRLQLDFSIKF